MADLGLVLSGERAGAPMSRALTMLDAVLHTQSMCRHSRWSAVDLLEPSPNRTLHKHQSAQRFGCLHATLPKWCMKHGDGRARHGMNGASTLRQCDQIGDQIETQSRQSKCPKRARQSIQKANDHGSWCKARDACVSLPLQRSQVPLTSPPNEPTP